MEDVSQIRNAAREYSNAFHRWMKAPADSEREAQLYSRMTDKIVDLSVIIVKHEASKRDREKALMQGLNHNKAAGDFLVKVLREMGKDI